MYKAEELDAEIVFFLCLVEVFEKLTLQKQPPEVFCKKKVFLKISQKKRLQHRYFPVKFKKYLKTPSLNNIYEHLQLLLLLEKQTFKSKHFSNY